MKTLLDLKCFSKRLNILKSLVSLQSFFNYINETIKYEDDIHTHY